MTTISRRSANITVRVVNGLLTPAAASSITLNNQGAVVGATTRLDTLTDVVEGSPVNNSTLVYNQEEDKYFVQELNLDGGNF